MKNKSNRLLAMLLAVVMLVGILPMTALAAAPSKVSSSDYVAYVATGTTYSRDFAGDEEASSFNKDNTTKKFSLEVVDAASISGDNNSGYGSCLKINQYETYSSNNGTVNVINATGGVSGMVYRVELDVFLDNASALYFNVKVGTDKAVSLKNGTHYTVTANQWCHISVDLLSDETGPTVSIQPVTVSGKTVTAYIDNLQVTEYTPITDANIGELATALAQEGQNIALFNDADMTGSSLTLGTGTTLDLNGNTLTAASLMGTAGQVEDNSAEKTGRLNVGSLALAANNAQFPVKDANGYYAMADLNMTDAYFNMAVSDENGFTLNARPGFGAASIRELVAAGNSGVTVRFRLSWKDVFGNTGSEDFTYEAADVADVYANAASGSVFQGTFVNPGNAEYYRADMVLESCGVEVTSENTSKPKYVNPNEEGKTYYVRNDDVIQLNSGATSDTYTYEGLNTSTAAVGTKMVVQFKVKRLEDINMFARFMIFGDANSGAQYNGVVVYNEYFRMGGTGNTNKCDATQPGTDAYTTVRAELVVNESNCTLSLYVNGAYQKDINVDKADVSVYKIVRQRHQESYPSANFEIDDLIVWSK